LLDAQLLAQVYVELTGGRQIGLGLLAETRQDEQAAVAGSIGTATRAVRPARPHAASLDELAAHAQFIARMKEPLWAAVGSA
jgi:DNA polymerase-3 subunit epsilon